MLWVGRSLMVVRGAAMLGTGRLLEDGESDWANTSWGLWLEGERIL